ncbi:hypothetical protein HDR58_06745 [bacterium]|nr:hypothetical protein [bacterium]
MRKLYTTLAILFALLFGFNQGTLAEEAANIEVLPTMNTVSTAPNRIWVGTFQIVWNEVMDKIVYGPIRFVKFNSPMAKALNKQEFKKTNISENSYYTKYGAVSPKLKSEIETGIKEKFNETSDILEMFDFSYQPDKLFIYAMLKKDFKFLTPFDKLSQGGFGNNYNLVDYFGINGDSNKKLYKNVNVLFYNSSNDFAVKLITKDKDAVILYRTDDDTTFGKYLADINKKDKKYTGSRKFKSDDKLRVPDINLYQEASFKELEGHDIKGSKFRIDKTIETVDFRMNNEGVKLKSEAAMIMKCLALPVERGRDFNFSNSFVLFLIEKHQKVPYFAMRVNDVQTLNSTGKK